MNYFVLLAVADLWPDQGRCWSRCRCRVFRIEGALKSGGEVRIVGFGTFSVAHRAATTGRNPRTGETIQIAASKQRNSRPAHR